MKHARLPRKRRRALNKFVYPARSIAASYFSATAWRRSIKRETFPFKRSFSIIKCSPFPEVSGEHRPRFNSLVSFVFHRADPPPYPTVTLSSRLPSPRLFPTATNIPRLAGVAATFSLPVTGRFTEEPVLSSGPS